MLSVTGSGNFVESNLYIEQGGDFEISCMAAGGPNNTHTWIQNGVDISNSVNFNISSSGNDTMSISTLRVDSVDAAIHKGSYSCEVVNEAGDHIQDITITGIYYFTIILCNKILHILIVPCSLCALKF